MRFLFIGVNFCMTACIFNYELGFFILKKMAESYALSVYRS